MPAALLRVSLFLAVVLAGCSSVPSYEGGPTKDEPYGIVQPEDGVKMWQVDGKPAFNKDGLTYTKPGNHTFQFRVDYPMNDESPKPFEYIDYQITVDPGLRYRVFIKGEFEKGPPYTLDQKVTKIRGYGSD